MRRILRFLAMTLVFATIAGARAGEKISEMPAAATPFGGTELFPIVQGGVNRSVNFTNLLSQVAPGANVSSALQAAIATGANVQAGTSSTNLVVPSALAGSAAVQTLTDGATINWDVSAGYNAKVTLGGNRTMAAPTNVQAGMTYVLEVIQDATGSRTVTWNSAFRWGTPGTPTLTTTANKTDLVVCFAADATPTLLCSISLGF